MNKFTKYLVFLCLGLTVGCTEAVEQVDTQTPSSNQNFETATLGLTTDTLANTDLGGVRYTVTEVDCATGDPVVPAHTESADVDLADMYIPGGNGTFEDTPYDADSEHLFADQYFDLAPGCYDVLVEPLQENGDLSEDCWSAHRDGVQVFAGVTTEILLIMQCRGEETGGLDVIATANHPPQIDDVQFEPSKFSCKERTQVCITISDPDSDPLAVKWDIEAGAQIGGTTIETNAAGETVACATIAGAEPGTYQVAATVFDMGYNANGDPVPIEELLAIQGDPHPSRATLRFPFHQMSEDACICECPEGFELNEETDTCERTETTSVVVNGEPLNVCSGNRSRYYSMLGAKYPGGGVEQNAFFGQGLQDSVDGRLNQVGVWACDPDSDRTGTRPFDEWIGFSTCIHVEEEGEYLVGIGADNRVRFSVDGTQMSPPQLENTDNVLNFEYWWMQRVTLSAGSHTIEMEGYNEGNVAAFGAEIYGPFPAGSLGTDAAMAAADVENNIIFSTADMIGGTFLTGEDSGLSCPDGFAIDACSDKVSCTQTIIRECINGNGGGSDDGDIDADGEIDSDGVEGDGRD